MNVTILTLGSRGDVQPYVALGRGLAATGHTVTLATHICWEAFVAEHGLRFSPVAGDPRGTGEALYPMNTETLFRTLFWSLLGGIFLMRAYFSYRVRRATERLLDQEESHHERDHRAP